MLCIRQSNIIITCIVIFIFPSDYFFTFLQEHFQEQSHLKAEVEWLTLTELTLDPLLHSH
jgi:hypothetical protein